MSTERKQIMEIYRITYRQEVFIKADSEEQASLYFENIDINNLSKEISYPFETDLLYQQYSQYTIRN